ncbi:hypothetical protein SS1G_08762 [Sclerotinia sclerotiorum 1980 UF-70]|uniref:Uncharacterized protein n=2 Tax=Sclerotinia sclerotiorum (strain ATCC 18683 / 1980 / Ss-1) TaxID=665079 RepID=A7ETV5_SCLS1|nr:hypothetical protein SS1G_08762 [Sclerotinia sclerotiorum 1980 UF-70]APA15164.1 hypothetical protein sscle_14g099340 [Sclerotinia sclerotiorum 1980 UF-70]EDN92897.1 hypothetical protein SS1G_08762 [Sclerotinia sclerotiorum 1980 UF-70]
MAGLAEHRRQKELAASVIHIGTIYGAGYASQLDRIIYSKPAFWSTALIPTFERDFYQLFAEVVTPDSGHKSIEILDGTCKVSVNDQDHPVRKSEPFLSQFIKNYDRLSSAVGDGQSRVPLKAQLAHAHDQNQTHSIV